MNKPLSLTLSVLAVASVLFCGCATSNRMNHVEIGMTKAQVIAAIGRPASTASPGQDREILVYRLSRDANAAFMGWTDDYYVKLSNNVVVAYGQKGDFGSAELPAQNIHVEVKQR